MSHRGKIAIRVAASAAAAAIATLAFAPAALSEALKPPVASLIAGPDPADVGETVSFDGAGSTGDGAGSTISSYEWDLDGDGGFEVSTGTASATSRSYAEPATITVRVRVTDSEGDIDEASTDLRVNAGPRAGFIFEPSSPEVNQRITFSSTSTDPDGQIAPSEHRWDFDGDGQFDEAVGETVTVAFPTAGVTTVGLQVTDSDGGDRDQDQEGVGRPPPAEAPEPVSDRPAVGGGSARRQHRDRPAVGPCAAGLGGGGALPRRELSLQREGANRETRAGPVSRDRRAPAPRGRDRGLRHPARNRRQVHQLSNS